MAKPKKTKLSARVGSAKHVHISPEIADHRQPLWSFRDFDNDGRWCWAKICEPDAMPLMQRLKNYESMTWDEIKRKDHNHYAEPREIIKDARDRLNALGKYETNVLFSLSIAGLPRLWGILYEPIFFALWWDPKHEIYDSKKK